MKHKAEQIGWSGGEGDLLLVVVLYVFFLSQRWAGLNVPNRSDRSLVTATVRGGEWCQGKWGWRDRKVQ